MSVLKVENLSKLYRLGEVGTGTISHDLNRWWAKMRGKEDPYALVGQTNDRSQKAESDYVWALKDINFEVQQGEILGIIGRNGAGKSTLLKILSQITSPTTGTIKTKGRIASLLEVGTGMHPEMTARENIYLNGAILGMTKKEIAAKFDEIVDFSGCALYVDTPLKRFSSGMRVRLGFAVAAFLEPEILIVDEVLAVGDAEFQKKAIGKMKDISSGGGRTVLFVSHNMASVKSLCTRGLIMNHGGIEFEGGIDEVVNRYAMSNRVSHSGPLLKTPLIVVDEFRTYGRTLLNKVKDTIDEHDQVIIDAEIQIMTDEDLRLTLMLSNAEGVTLFAFSQKDKYLPRGRHKVLCEIPPGFLNVGEYYLSLFIINKSLKTVHREDNINIFNVDFGQHPIGSWMGKEPGFIKPLFNWKFETLHET